MIDQLDAAFGDPNGVVIAERKLHEMKQMNYEFSQYYDEFEVIATDGDSNTFALRNALRIGQEKDSFPYRNRTEQFHLFLTVCEMGDNFHQHTWRGKGAPNTGGGTGFTSSAGPPAPRIGSAAAPARTVARYTGPVPMGVSTVKRRNSVEERVKRFTDRRCLYCGRFNHRAADCAARKKVQMLKAVGAEVKDIGTGTGSEEMGKE